MRDHVRNDAESQLEKLLLPETRKHLMKMMLVDEWAKSIEDAHEKEGAATTKALIKHYEEARVISKIFP